MVTRGLQRLPLVFIRCRTEADTTAVRNEFWERTSHEAEPNQPRHRIAALLRFLLNMKGRV